MEWRLWTKTSKPKPDMHYVIDKTYWGRRRNATNWSYNNVPTTFLFDRGYTGHEHLDKFSLINMNGRVYDPWLGRMLSPDPIVQDPSYSQNYNRYTYANNNPLKYTDPSGYRYMSDFWVMPGWARIFQGGGGVGSLSGNHWSNQYKGEYGNWMLMSSSSFNNVYGTGAAEIGGQINSNAQALSNWRSGILTINDVRNAGSVDAAVYQNQGDFVGSAFYKVDANGKYTYFGFSDADGNQIFLNPNLNANTQGIIGDIIVNESTGYYFYCPQSYNFLPTITQITSEYNSSGLGMSIRAYSKAVTKGGSALIINNNKLGCVVSIGAKSSIGTMTVLLNGGLIYSNDPLSVGMDMQNYLVGISFLAGNNQEIGLTLAADKTMVNNTIHYGWAVAAIVHPELRLVPIF